MFTSTEVTESQYKQMQYEVKEKIITARVGLLLRHPWFGNMSTRLQLVESDDWCPTAATDGRTLYYNVQFMNSLDIAEIEFVVAHEILHCAFDHIIRVGDRIKMLYNIACDYLVNNVLVRDKIGKAPSKIKIYQDFQYNGWTSEEVYDLSLIHI